MVLVADGFAAWLTGLLADAARRKVTTFVLGTDQDRALHSAAAAAIKLTAEEVRPDDEEQSQYVASVISEVFREPVPYEPLARHKTILAALQAGIAGQLAVLDDASLTGTGQSAAEALEVSADVLAEKLTGQLLRAIVVRGARGGPLFPLASQLNDDITHLQGQHLEDLIGQLSGYVLEALARLDRHDAVGVSNVTPAPRAILPLGASRYALIVTTSDYADPAIRRMPAGAADVASLGSVLGDADIGGFTVAIVRNGTAMEVRTAIEQHLSGRALDDVVLLYLSCHGIRDQIGGLYFAAADTQIGLLESTGIESQWLLNRLADCAARSQILILDCAFHRDYAVPADGGEAWILDNVTHSGRGPAILTASSSYEDSASQRAPESADPAGAIYTAGLVQGLRSGVADTDGDGYISVLDAHNYASAYVKRGRAEQTPFSWLYGSQGQVWLARSSRVRHLRQISASERDLKPVAAEEAHEHVEMFELLPRHLGMNCVISQALDDQWVSRALIAEMAAGQKSLSELGEKRDALIRREYLRALLTAKKTVINRSYLLKNEAISRDYKTDPVSRAAFIELLRAGAIVPFLLKERTPGQSEFASDPDAAEGARIWNELLSESDPGGRGRVALQCVRLSWDDAENERLVKERLFDAFAGHVMDAATLDYRRMLADVGVAATDAFEEQLRLFPQMSASWQEVGLSRTALYQRYIIEDREPVSSGKYDFTKPDMIAFKWLFDLIYNSNLAAVLGLALISPADSAHRAAVYRPKGTRQFGVGLGSPLESGYLRTSLMEAVQHALFSDDYSAASLAVFDGLTLSDVVAIRNTDIWRDYIGALDSLLAEPWLMSHPERGLPFVYGRFWALIKYISGIATAGSAASAR